MRDLSIRPVRWRTGRRARWRRRAERGGVGVIVAVLIGGGVLIAMGALVIDVGQLYENRAELQNGADAGALGVARTCALTTCNASVATSYAIANASKLTGFQASATMVCGDNGPAGGLTGCGSGNTGTLTDCPPNPASGNYVDVHTATLTPSGNFLPAVFAKTLLGNGNYSGSRVYACAQAVWGPALAGNSLAVTMSYCAWNSATNGGANFGPTALTAVYLKSKANSTCFGPAGSIPGGFDWLAPTTSNVCTALINLTTDTTYSDTGSDTSAACKQAVWNDVNSYVSGTPVTVFIPVFDAVSGTGANLTYTITGMAGFVPTGYWDLTGGAGSGLPNKYGNYSLCTANQDPCIEGYFTQALDPVTSVGTGTNFGATAAKLTG
jgi:Flp pilus assembly protein TadG